MNADDFKCIKRGPTSFTIREIEIKNYTCKPFRTYKTGKYQRVDNLMRCQGFREAGALIFGVGANW